MKKYLFLSIALLTGWSVSAQTTFQKVFSGRPANLLIRFCKPSMVDMQYAARVSSMALLFAA
jgi:hypothetical protein